MPRLIAVDPGAVARFGVALERLVGPVGDRRIGVAVSGGPDSVALLLLAHAAYAGQVEAATFDHRYRDASTLEAQAVAAWCGEPGIRHERLALDLDEVQLAEHRRGFSQATAREHRYAWLTRWCGRREIDLLLTAHHADDQAETLLMRLARGAGVGGLAGIRATKIMRGTKSNPFPDDAPHVHSRPHRFILARPLLGFSKAELATIVAAAGIDPVDDPSNRDPRFDRTRVRALLAGAGWIDARRIAASASHMADAEAALAWAAARLFAETAEEMDDGLWQLRPDGVPADLLRRVTEMAIMGVWTKMHLERPIPLRGDELSRFVARLCRGEAATLAGVKGSANRAPPTASGTRPGGTVWRFEPAAPHRGREG